MSHRYGLTGYPSREEAAAYWSVDPWSGPWVPRSVIDPLDGGGLLGGYDQGWRDEDDESAGEWYEGAKATVTSKNFLVGVAVGVAGCLLARRWL